MDTLDNHVGPPQTVPLRTPIVEVIIHRNRLWNEMPGKMPKAHGECYWKQRRRIDRQIE